MRSVTTAAFILSMGMLAVPVFGQSQTATPKTPIDFRGEWEEQNASPPIRVKIKLADDNLYEANSLVDTKDFKAGNVLFHFNIDRSEPEVRVPSAEVRFEPTTLTVIDADHIRIGGKQLFHRVSAAAGSAQPKAPLRAAQRPSINGSPTTCAATNPASITADAAINRGRQAANAQQVDETICWFKIAADKGNVPAMKGLGDIYHRLNNYDEARKWLIAAANHHDTQAMENLGRLAQDQHDYGAAERWYRNAIDNGDIDAYYNLGVLEFEQKVYPAAFNSFLLAAKQGNSFAEYNLSIMTDNGYGTPKNVPEAFRWMELSAKHGNAQAAKIIKVATEQAQKAAAQPVKTASAQVQTPPVVSSAPTTSADAQEKQNKMLYSLFGIVAQNMMRQHTPEEIANEEAEEKAQKDKDYDRFMKQREDCISQGGNGLGPCILPQ